MIYDISKNKIVFDVNSMGPWCLLPYPNHKKGCPNYAKKKGCPPFSERYYDLIEPPFFLSVQTFDLGKHAIQMKKRHLNWTDKQCRNLLYWQNKIRKTIKDESYQFASDRGKNFIVLETPEANGINIFETCKNIGILLNKNPSQIVYKIMLVGKSIKSREDFSH